MGVHGLWGLLHPSGRPVTLESLEGKVLAVDVSIWLHQSMKGMRDKDGNALPNAHLQGLFSRVCKLLFYRIKPVFVFDGGIPDLKRQTLAARREKKSEAMRERDEIGKKLLQNLIKSQAVKQALRAGGSNSGSPVKVPGVSRKGDKDLFELAPLPEAQENGLAINSEAWDTHFEQQENWIKEGLSTLSKVDPDSAEFKSLPMEIQHEALVDLKEERKFHSLSRISKMPEDADSFSNYQLKKLMKVCNLTTRIDEVRKDMANRTTTALRYELGDDYYGEAESRRIVSEDASHYILIKGLSKEKQLEEAERYDLESRVKIEKEEGDSDNTKEAATSTAKRQMKEKDYQVIRKKLKNDRGKDEGDRREILTKGALISSTALTNRNDDGDSEESNDENIGERDTTDNSSSEDEGFIEVTFDPNQAVEEDELFPSSIFTTTQPSYPPTRTSDNIEIMEDIDTDNNTFRQKSKSMGHSHSTSSSSSEADDSPVVEEMYNKNDSLESRNKSSQRSKVIQGRNMNRNYEKDRSERQKKGIGKNKETFLSISDMRDNSSRAMLVTGNVETDKEKHENIVEKRKSVLSDIMEQLKRQKESLENLSSGQVESDIVDFGEGRVDDDDDDDNGGRIMEKDVDSDDEHDDDGDDDDDDVSFDGFNSHGRIEDVSIKSDKKPDAMKEDFSFSGGFIREESNSDDDEEEEKRRGFELFEGGSNRVVDVGSGDGAVVDSSPEGRLNDSEDEDLKLAIELSLQTAEYEQKSKEVESKKPADRKPNFGDVNKDDILSVGDYDNENVADAKMDDDVVEDDNDDDDFEMVEPIGDEGNSGDSSSRSDKMDSLDEFNMFEGEDGEGGPDITTSAAMDKDDHDHDEDYENDEYVAAVKASSLETASTDIADSNSPTKAILSQERLQPEDVADPFMEFQQSNLQNIREELANERSGLLSEQGRQDRFATSLTDQIVQEAQELLNMFGIPYVVSPMEAEAQCAFLDCSGQTQGTITDDSDIWLFGGSRVYKNFFNQTKFVEFFSLDSINSHFGLTREQLIQIALLCGSDYTVGIPGVGPVRALEIMGEFQGDGLEGLMAFRKWWDSNHKKPAMPGENKLRARLKQISLEGGFPSESVMEAYLVPEVDESMETFSWGHPDLDHLRHFAKIKFGWAKDKVDSILDPMMKQFLKRQTQAGIRSFFQSHSYVPASTATAHSDRIKKALSVMQCKKSSISPSKDNAMSQGQSSRKDQPTKKTQSEKISRKRRGDDNNDDDGVEVQNVKMKKRMENTKKDGGLNEEKSVGGSKRGEKGEALAVMGKKGKIEEKKRKVGKSKREIEALQERQHDLNSGSDCVMGDSISGSCTGIGKVSVKTEPGSVDEYGDGLMKAMQMKVAKASSVLEKGLRGKRGGGGGGVSARPRGTGKSVKGRGVSSVPSLERKGVKGRGQRGRSSSILTSAHSRGVVCLSESSSSSSSDTEDDGNANESNEKDFGLTDNSRQHVVGNRNENPSVGLQMFMSEQSLARGNKIGNSVRAEKQQEDVYKGRLNSNDSNSNMEGKNSNTVKGRHESLKGATSRNAGETERKSPKNQNLKKNEGGLMKSKLRGQVDPRKDERNKAIQKVDIEERETGSSFRSSVKEESNKERRGVNIAETKDHKGDKQAGELKRDGRGGKKVVQVPMKNIRGDRHAVQDCEGSTGDNEVDHGKGDNKEADQDLEKGGNRDERGSEKIGRMMGQVPGKNPDVSLINAITLKATMSYLNQRSSGEKHLLNALGGKKPTNAVERRLEEEERRRKRGSVNPSDGRESGSMTNRKEVKSSQAKQEVGDSRTKPSFEDMLGGTEDILIASKLKSAAGKRERSNVNKSSAVTEKPSSSDNKSTKNKGNDGLSASRKQVKTKGVVTGSRCKSNRNVEGDKGRTDHYESEGKKVRMKSVSDDSSSEESRRVEKKKKSHRHESAMSTGSVEHSRKGKEDLVKEMDTDGSTMGSGTVGSKCGNSNVTSNVVGGLGNGEGKLDKFGLQVSYLWDKQSVRGHGGLPRQGRSRKSQMFDLPLDGGVNQRRGVSRKKQAGGFVGVSPENTAVGGDGCDSGDGAGDGGSSGRSSGHVGCDGSGGKDGGVDDTASSDNDNNNNNDNDNVNESPNVNTSSKVRGGRAVAGKGKGIGKNRNGRQQHGGGGIGSGSNTGGGRGGSGISDSVTDTKTRDQVSSVLASSGVTDVEIMEYGCVGMDDLGSDFDDEDFY